MYWGFFAVIFDSEKLKKDKLSKQVENILGIPFVIMAIIFMIRLAQGHLMAIIILQ